MVTSGDHGPGSRRRRGAAARTRPALEPLEGRTLMSVAPLIYFGPRTGTIPPGSVAVAQVPHLPTPREQLLQQFGARFKGTYLASPGRFTDQAQQFFLTGAGQSNQFLHADIIMALYTPVNPGQPVTGQLSIIDKNASNTGNILGLDLVGDPASLDAAGRPTRLNWTVNGSSGGTYSGATGSGTLDLTYRPALAHSPGPFQKGGFGAVFRGTIETSRVTNTLRFT